METHRVPGDRLIESAHVFSAPSLDQVRNCFEEIHEASENVYQGGGVWGESLLGAGYPPVYRETAWRVIGYAYALEAENEELYRRRIFEGAEYLLREQQEKWERSREPKSAYSVHPPEIPGPFALHSLTYLDELTDLDLTNVLHGVLRAPLPDDRVGQGMPHLAYGAGYRWMHKRGAS